MCSVSVSNQEEVPLHGRGVPGSKLEHTAFPEELVGGVNHLLVSNHLIDLQQPLQALLQVKKEKQICMDTTLVVNGQFCQ